MKAGFLSKIAEYGFLALAFLRGIAAALFVPKTKINNDDLLDDNYNYYPPNTNEDNIVDVECEDVDTEK